MLYRKCGLYLSFGDPSVLPRLSDLLDGCKPHQKYRVIELAGAIEELGGTLTKHQQRLLDRARAAKKMARQGTTFNPTGKLSRLASLPRPGVSIKF